MGSRSALGDYSPLRGSGGNQLITSGSGALIQYPGGGLDASASQHRLPAATVRSSLAYEPGAETATNANWATSQTGEPQMQQRNQHTPELPVVRRHLPIKDKEKVFNEWAAVIKHQDETEQSRIQQEKEEIKQR